MYRRGLREGMDTRQYGYDQQTEPLSSRSVSKSPHSKRLNISKGKAIGLLVLLPLFTLVIGLLIGLSSHTSRSDDFATSSVIVDTSTQQDVRDLLFNNLKAENIKRNLKALASKVHLAGTSQEEDILVDLIVNNWKEQLDEVKVYPYDVLLSVPNEKDPNYVAMKNSDGSISHKSKAYESPLTPWEEENFKTIKQPTFLSYAAAGHVEGQLVFVNYGRVQDFETISRTLNIDVRGKICIVKFGKIFRGDKAIYAERNGCSGLIMYSDPADYSSDSTYPNGWGLPPDGVQRGSLHLRDGDPLTPFYPSIKSSYRIPENETGLPTIPVQPISAEDALIYLSSIGGDSAPSDWMGGLNITYKLGGKMTDDFANHNIVLHVANTRPITEVKNIIGFIRGSVEPDRYVMIGNHRDAWVFGALDPSSGTAVMLEVARVMGEMVKSGKWRPRRSIVFCSWAAEEYGLIGSIEWVEQFEKKLLMNAVTYLNVDIAVQGTATFRARATPNLRSILYEVTKEVPNPDPKEVANNRPTVYDTWKKVYYDKNNNGRPFVGFLGSGSDYMMFVQKTGVSSLDIRYTFDEHNKKLSSYPVYHSAHDTIEYFEKFLDPDYKFSLAMARIWGDLARRFADDSVIPFNPIDYAEQIRDMINIIDKNNAKQLAENGIRLDGLHSAAETLLKSSIDLARDISNINITNFLQVRELNDKLMYLDRAFLDFQGLPGRPYFRHVVFAPSVHDSYAGAGFSGLTDAIYEAKRDGNWEKVKKQLSITTFHLLSAASTLTKF
ncbi:putative N-acetylated-alpha-linked acidic dipeptidase [Styela clava]